MRKAKQLRFTPFPVWIFFYLIINTNVFAENERRSLIYCVDPNWAPYESIIDGQHVGISKHYLTLLEGHLNLNLTFLPTQTWQESLQALADEKCHLTPLLNHSDERAQTIAFSDIYFRAPNAIYAHLQLGLVGGLSSLTDQSIAVVRGYRLTHYLQEHFPNLKLVEVDSEAEGLEQVNKHEVDLFIGSFYTANLLINELALINIRIVGIAELEDQLRVGVSLQHKDLIADINNALARLTEEDHRSVFKQIAAGNAIKYTDYTLTWQVASIALVLLILITTRHYYSLKQRKVLANKNNTLERLRTALEKKNQLLAKLAITDHLTNLHNRNYLSEQIGECIKLKKRYQTPACMLLIDIDDFKQFNDKFGHQIGDEILVKISAAMKECARETDITARWGGEELVILCPSTSLNEALSLANRFQQTVSRFKQADDMPVTCSIGVAELGQNENENQWFYNADKAMYQAKSAGKNRVNISND